MRLLILQLSIMKPVDFSTLERRELRSSGLLKVKVKAVCGSYSTAALRHIVLLPK